MSFSGAKVSKVDVPCIDTPQFGSKDFEDFVYLISHDVRSSVRALLELPQWIKEDLEEAGTPITGQVAASIELMDRHTGRLDRMLVDLLTFSRIGRMQEVRRIDLRNAVADVLEELELPQAFSVIVDIPIVSITIGDRDVLTLLSALVSNAVKHHDKGRGKIMIVAEAWDGKVAIKICDDGPGIPEEFRGRVFGAMTTLRPRDEVEGSGMGLANVRKIAHLYGGTAEAGDSPYGRGTMICVTLPLSEREVNQ